MGRPRKSPRRPAAVRHVIPRRHIAGAAVRPRRLGDGTRRAGVVAERMRNAARALAALHALSRIRSGLAGEPRVGFSAEIDRWCRLLETVDPGLAPGWPDVAAGACTPRPALPRADRARRLPARATCWPPAPPSRRSSTGRSGVSATRGSTWAGSSSTRTRRPTNDPPGTPAAAVAGRARRGLHRSPGSRGAEPRARSGPWRASSPRQRGR